MHLRSKVHSRILGRIDLYMLEDLPCRICCCNPTACNCCNRCNEAGVIESVAVRMGLDCCGGFGSIVGVAGAGEPIFILAAAKFHRFACICCIFFCSFSFCVSANLTTIGAEQPSIVCDWCKPFRYCIGHTSTQKKQQQQRRRSRRRRRQ